MQVLCLYGLRKSKPRVKSELHKQLPIYCDIFLLQSFGTINSSLADIKICVAIQFLLLFYFEFEGSFQVQAPRGLYLEGRFNGGFFVLRVWGYLYMEGLIFGILQYLLSFAKSL